MITLQQVRDKYPQYQNKSDKELADAIYYKHYYALPKDEYYKKIGIAKDEPKVERTSALGAFGRSAIRTAPEAISNLANKFGANIDLVPKFSEEKPGDIEHPYAEFGGSLLGFGPLGGTTIAAARTIPIWGAVASRAAPSILRRLGVGMTEGGLLGGLYSPPGQSLEGASGGAVLGGALHSILPELPGALKNIKQTFGKAKEIDVLRSQHEQAIKALESAGLSHEQALDTLNTSQIEATHEHNMSNPENMQFKLNESNKKLEGLKEKLSQPMATNPIEQETPIQTPVESNLKAPQEPLLPEPHTFEPKSQETGRLLVTAQEKQAQAEENIKQHLGEGQIHHERFGTATKEEFNKLEDINKKNYSDVDKVLDKHNVTITNNAKVVDLLRKISSSMQEHGRNSEETQKLQEQIDEARKSKSIPAKSFLNMYRVIRNSAHEAMGTAKENPHTEIGNKAYESAQLLHKQATNMYGLLKSSIPEDIFKKLESAQSYFKETIAPLRENTLAREIRKKGKVSGSILEKLVGTETGLPIIQGIVQKNPELMRLSVGQEFAHAPTKLHLPNELLEQRYLPNMPELQQLLKIHKETMPRLEYAKSEHEAAKIHDIEQQKLAGQVEKERATKQKSYEAEKKKYETQKDKERARLNKPKAASRTSQTSEAKYSQMRIKVTKDIASLEHKIQDLKKRIPDLRHKQHMTLQEKIKYEARKKEANDLESQIKEGEEGLRKMRAIVTKPFKYVGGLALAYGLYKAKNAITK